MSTLDALPPESSAAIIEELTTADPSLLAQLQRADEPTYEQRAAVNDVIASAIVKNFDGDWVPNARAVVLERAIEAFFVVWPLEAP